MKRISGALTYNGQFVTIPDDMPELKDHQVLVEIHSSLISPGTETGMAKKSRLNPWPADSKPGKFGYSSAGIILQTQGDCGDLKPGMRVACMGAYHSNYSAVPMNLAFPLPDEISFDEAVFLPLAATALQAVRRTDVKLGEYGAVLGQGIVGNLASQLYRLCGARVVNWETLPLRSDIARKCGNDLIIDFANSDAVELSKEFASPYGLDFALFAFGGDAEKAFMDIKKCMKISADGHAMGNVVLVGGCRVPVDGGAWSGNLNVLVSSRTGAGYHDPEWELGREYPAAFVQFTTRRNFTELIKLILEKRLHIKPMITHHYDFEQLPEAGDLLTDHPEQALGVVLQMKH